MDDRLKEVVDRQGHHICSWAARRRALELGDFVRDFAAALKEVDAERPQFRSRTGRLYQPGLGPHAEDRAVDLIVGQLKRQDKHDYKSLSCRALYAGSRQACDLVIGEPIEWMIEVKMARFLGDNGKPDDTALKDVLSPFDSDRSAVSDCTKLIRGAGTARTAILIYGFNAPGKSMTRIFRAFEAVASLDVRLTPCHMVTFDGLVHPVHSHGAVGAWEIRPKN
jgi:hypothetical protein